MRGTGGNVLTINHQELTMFDLFRRTKKAVALSALVLFSPLVTSQVGAVPITGGVTRVQLLSPIATAIVGAGVTPSATGTGSFDLNTLTFNFPITGGDLATPVIPGSTIQHNGSGIRFAAGTISIEIGNFLIDTTSLLISGSVRSLNPAQGSALDLLGVPLFALAIGNNPSFPFSVSLTGAAAGALNATFNTTLFSAGLQIGNASTAPLVGVPEPATYGFLVLGLAGMAVARRRKLNAGIAA
jgi:PEP-CTERM motif